MSKQRGSDTHTYSHSRSEPRIIVKETLTGKLGSWAVMRREYQNGMTVLQRGALVRVKSTNHHTFNVVTAFCSLCGTSHQINNVDPDWLDFDHPDARKHNLSSRNNSLDSYTDSEKE